MRNIYGFTLLELLCSIAISLILLTMMLTVVLGFRRNFYLLRALAEMQESSRYASYVLRHTVSQAGNIGCAELTADFPITDCGEPSEYNKLYEYNLIVFNESDWKDYLSSSYKLTPKKGSDILVVHSLDNKRAVLLQPAVHTNVVSVTVSPIFESGDPIAMSDCRQAVLTTIKSVSRSDKNRQQQLTLASILPKDFDVGSEVGQLSTKIFVIQATSRKNREGEAIYALYEVDAQGRRTELVPGVYNMKVQCFEESPSGAVIEENPEQVSHWHNVKLLKVWLLLRSEQNVLQSGRPYQFMGENIQPTDKRFYQQMVITIPVHF